MANFRNPALLRLAAKGWHSARFIEDPRKQRVECTVCKRPMWLPKSKAASYLRCSEECSAIHRQRLAASRIRSCATCSADFIPRQAQLRAGGGRFCSQRCNTVSRSAMHSPEARKKAVATFKASVADGLVIIPSGPDNPRWKGGPSASERRLRESGKKAAGTRRYRSENPHKVREFSARRQGRKLGRLPRGTIASQGAAQSWLCFICSVGISSGYHVDHWMPLALGGEHKPENIRLLCPVCNVRKGAKHPDVFLAGVAA